MVLMLCLVRVKILWVKLMNLCRTEQSESTRCSRQNKSTRFVLLLSGERCTGGDQTVTHTTGWWLDSGFWIFTSCIANHLFYSISNPIMTRDFIATNNVKKDLLIFEAVEEEGKRVWGLMSSHCTMPHLRGARTERGRIHKWSHWLWRWRCWLIGQETWRPKYCDSIIKGY